jgi:hypothetical protein
MHNKHIRNYTHIKMRERVARARASRCDIRCVCSLRDADLKHSHSIKLLTPRDRMQMRRSLAGAPTLCFSHSRLIYFDFISRAPPTARAARCTFNYLLNQRLAFNCTRVSCKSLARHASPDLHVCFWPYPCCFLFVS